MSIILGKPFAVTDKGKRTNNEDCVYPLPEVASSSDNLFIVCDGVGGANKGEIASATTCDVIQSFFRTFLQGNSDKSFINKAVQYVETCFDSYIKDHQEASGMATTMALIHIMPSSVLISHIGDSRIYHFRNGKIISKTEDHSLVNSWIQLGKITPEEARMHPQKNVILRAIQGGKHPVEAETILCNDLADGDVFFICTDGVIESFSDEELENLFSEPISTEKRKDIITEKCTDNSRDNFSFYIIPIESVQKTESLKQNFFSFLYSFI